MRLLTFTRAEAHGRAPEPELGALEDGRILPLRDALAEAGLASRTLEALLAEDPDLARTREAVDAARAGRATLAREDVRILPPLRPSKVVCVGLNYRDHVAEQNMAIPEKPVLFAKLPNAVVGEGDRVIHHDLTHALDLEAELGVVIGRRARRVAAADALEHVAGWTIVNDVTARDFQGNKAALREGEKGDGQWLRAKSSDTFCPLGPVVVTRDELAGAEGLTVRGWRVPLESGPHGDAGQPFLMQEATTAMMLRDVPALIEYISAVFTLEPGDVIATGTPSGVGVFRDPPVFLQPGDVVRAEIDGIGALTNPIADADGNVPSGSPAAALLAGADLFGAAAGRS